MLGLADQVGGDVRGVGGVVGEHGDLGGAGLGVDAHHAAQVPLGGHDPEVAGPGDQVDRRAQALDAVGEHRDRLSAADGVDLVDAQQVAQAQDGRVRQPAELCARRGGHREGADAGDLRGHDVHQHAAGQRREAAGHIETDARHRDGLGLDHGAGCDLGADQVRRPLGLGDLAAPADGLGEGRAHLGVELVGAARQHLGRYTQVLGTTLSNRSANSRRAASPRSATASQIPFTAPRAWSMSNAPRGTTAR